MVLLERSGVKLEGANAVVLGRSNIVGMPVAALLLHANATVTTCHSRSKDLPGICRCSRRADSSRGQGRHGARGLDQARRGGDRRGRQPC